MVYYDHVRTGRNKKSCMQTHEKQKSLPGRGGESGMTDKEWRMAQNFSKLPEALQIKMLDKLDGK